MEPLVEPPARKGSARGWRRALLVTALLAALPRALFLIETFDSIEFNGLLEGLDPYAFHQNALRIVSGDLALAGEPYSQAPFYSYFTAALYVVFGEDVRAVRIFQALLGVASCLLLFAAAARRFAPGIAASCAALYALYDFAIFMESALLRASLMAFLYLLLLHCVDRHLETGRRSWIAAAGLVLGIAVATRPNSLLLLPFVAWAVRGRAEGGVRWAVLAAAVLLPLIPFAVRNVVVGDPVLHFSSQGLGVFVSGNMPDSRGVGWLVSEQGEQLMAAERERAPAVLAGLLRAVAAHPLDWLLVQARKLHALFASYEVPNNLNLYLWREASRVLRASPVNVHVIATLGVAGLFIGWRRGGRRHLHALFAGVALTILPFYVIGRFRLPLVPWLCLFAGFSLEAIVAACRQRAGRRLAALAAGLAATFAATTSPVRERVEPGAHVSLALHYHHHGRREAALREYRRAFEKRPALRRAAEPLVGLLLETGRYEEAVAVAEAHLAVRPGNERMRALRERARAAAGMR